MASGSNTKEALPLAGKWTDIILRNYGPNQVPEPILKHDTKEIWEKQ
ncbi:hypothetical protein A2U01_0086008, partial [Trifolium medium]|nr:hypothetical protein [Trifolium medium]